MSRGKGHFPANLVFRHKDRVKAEGRQKEGAIRLRKRVTRLERNEELKDQNIVAVIEQLHFLPLNQKKVIREMLSRRDSSASCSSLGDEGEEGGLESDDDSSVIMLSPLLRRIDGNEPISDRPSSSSLYEDATASSRAFYSSSSLSFRSVASFPGFDATNCVNCGAALGPQRRQHYQANTCATCFLWVHYNCTPEKANNETNSSECFFCQRLANVVDSSRMQFKMTQKCPDNEIKPKINNYSDIDEGPKGHWKSWVYFWNLFMGDFNVKVGDYVYVTRGSQTGSAFGVNRSIHKTMDLMIFQVQYLIKDADQMAWFYGSTYSWPKEIKRNYGQKFYKNEIFRNTMLKGSAPLSTVVGVCAVLSTGQYLKGTMRGIPEENTYICDYRYSSASKQQAKIKAPKRGVKLCLSECAFARRKRVLRGLKRTLELSDTRSTLVAPKKRRKR